MSWLGLFLLIFNVLGGGALPARAADAGLAPFAQDLLGDRIVICTAAGMVVMDRDGNVIDTGGNSAHTDFCVFCLPLMHGGAQAPTAQAVIVDTAAEPVADFSPTEPTFAKPARLTGASSPRAPPLS